MRLQKEFEKTGIWLFRWRSYLPLVMIGMVVLVMPDYNYIYDNHHLDRLWELLCLTVSLFGLGIRAYTIGYAARGTSGRNTKAQRADVLNTTGMYSVVRHPLYLGNFFIYLGIALFVHHWWLTLVYILLFGVYYERIMFAEEAFLREKFGVTFEMWAKETPALIPHVTKWVSPDAPFSVKTVLKREYSGFFGIITTLTVLEGISHVAATRTFEIDAFWMILFIIGSIACLTLRLLRKKTSMLHGR
jgi:protein-S-isoprenylcysteine O-methyltransferase Ste14